MRLTAGYGWKDKIASFVVDIFLTALGVTGIYFKFAVVFLFDGSEQKRKQISVGA